MKLEVVKENKLNERYTIPVDSKLHHKHDGTIKENDTIYTVTIFNNKGENGHDIIMSNADDAFDEVFFNTPEEAKSFADKNYPDAWNVMIREEDWYDETLGDTRTSGPFLKRENGKWFDPQADWKKENDVRLNEGAGINETRIGKTKEVKVLQGNYGYGWDDLVEYDIADFNGDLLAMNKEIRQDLKDYEENETNASHRVVTRRVARELKEDKEPDEEEFDPMKDARGNILEFPNGGDSIVLNVEYKDGKLIAGSATNAGIIPEFEIEYDKDFDLDWNLNVLYNVIVEEHPEYLEMKGMKEAYREQPNEREVEELSIYIRNDSDIYQYHTIPTAKSLARKKIKGIYDKDLAIKAFEYVAKAGADKYKKEFADDDYEQFTFNPATRHETAKQLLDSYEELIDDYVKHPEELRESIKTRKSVRVKEAQNVEDQVIVDIRKPGYLSKMDELRKQGYKRLWSGDGKICFAKPKELKENRTLTEEVSSEAYEVANKMKIAFDKMDKVTWDDFDEQFALAIRDTFGIDNIWEQEDEFKLDTDTGKIDINDFENDIRGILGMNGYETELEGENEGGLKRITENKSLKEDYSDSDIRRAIFRVHDVMEDTYTQVVENITSRALDNNPEEDVYEAVCEAIDEGLIYYNDEWAVIEHYTTPKDIDSDTYNNAIQQLVEDVVEVVNYLLENGDSLTESTTTDILKNQSQDIEKPTTTGEAQSPAYADATRELGKAKEIKDKKVGADLDNVLNKKFDLGKAKKLTLDESLFN